MKTFVQPGQVLQWTNNTGSTVTSGSTVLIGAAGSKGLVAVAHGDILNGAVGQLITEGVITLPTDTGTAWTMGDRVYWDNTNLVFTKTSGGNTPAGFAAADKASGAATASIKLWPIVSQNHGEFANGNSGATPTTDWNNGDCQSWTANANLTFTLSNPVKGKLYRLKITQDATGTRTYTWPGSVKWTGGSAPTGSGANKVDIIELYYDGTNYFGRSNLNY